MTLVLEVGPEGGLVVPADVFTAQPGARYEWRWEGERFVLEPADAALQRRQEAAARLLALTEPLMRDEPPTYDEIQAEVDAVRQAKRAADDAQTGR